MRLVVWKEPLSEGAVGGLVFKLEILIPHSLGL